MKKLLFSLLIACLFYLDQGVLGQNTLTYSSTIANCSDSNSALIAVYIKGGQSPYQYVLTNGSSSITNSSGIFYGLGAGNYNVSVTDAAGIVVSANGISISPNTYLLVTPNDTTSCPNSNLLLVVTGGTGNYNWSSLPPDPTLMAVFNDSVVVSPILNTVYTVATNDLNTNLLFNGTFEYGDIGFFSGYTSLFPNNLTSMLAAYGIVNNAATWQPNYSSCVDHTLGNGIGKMMAISGAASGNTPFWQQTIAVEKNKNYVFSYFVQSLTNPNSGTIQVEFNSTIIGIDSLPLLDCDWEIHSYTWFSGNDSSVTITLTDFTSSAIGNDFAVDDMSLSTLKSCSATSTVEIATVNTDLGLQYPANACVGGNNVPPILNPTYPTNGSFNVLPAGLNVHPVTGIISLGNATPGTYQLIYSLPLCNQLVFDTAFITIRPKPNLLQLTGGAYNCDNQDFNPLALLVNGTAPWNVYYSLDGLPQNVLSATSLPISLDNAIGTYTLDSIQDAYCSNVVVGTQSISILDGPQIPQFLGDTVFCENETTSSVQISNYNPSGSANWYNDPNLTNYLFSDNEVFPSNDTSATFYVTQVVNNCEGPYAAITITIIPCGFVIPTAFTPNNDGQNDTWEIVGIDSKYPTNTVRVFNRWGESLFESIEGKYDSNRWDGKFKGEPLPVGSYYYIIELAKDKSTEPINGTVSIIRLP